jgi:type I restriction enzyme, S subunit
VSAASKLPAGWARCELGDVVDYGRTEKVEPSEIDDQSWILELEDVEKDTSRLLQRTMFRDRRSKSTKNRFQSGDVLYGKLRPYLNKVLHADANGFCTTEIVPLRAPKEVNARYLFYWLKHPEFSGYVNAVSHGLNMPRLGTEAGRKAPFVLAPRNEQTRIASKLDALLARLDACRDRLERIPAVLDIYRQSVLSAAVTGRLTHGWREATCISKGAEHSPDMSPLEVDAKPDDQELEAWLCDLPGCWRIERASHVVEPGAEIVYGIVQPGPKLSEGVPYIRGMDIVDGEILVDQLLRTSPAIAQRYARSSLRGGDVLLGIIRATKVAVVPDSLNGANITQGTARFRPSAEILTGYLALVLEAPETQRWLHGHYRGIDMPGLNLADVRRVPIPLPSLEEQTEVVRRAEGLLSAAARIQARMVAALGQIQDLAPCLLAKAYAGELVEHDPDDEPAGELLKRIRTGDKTGSRRTGARLSSTKPALPAIKKKAAQSKLNSTRSATRRA